MFLNKFIQSFLPKDKVFYTIFEKMGANVLKMGNLLDKQVSSHDVDERASISIEIGDLEHDNDNLTHQIFVELSENFITPFDREDVHHLASAMDDIADYIYTCSKKIILYKVNPNDSAIQKFAELIRQSCIQVQIIVNELRNMNKSTELSNAVVRINSIENQADDVYDLGVESLFEQEDDIKTVIKKREIYQLMEIVTDKCEDVSNIIDTIIIKYS